MEEDKAKNEPPSTEATILQHSYPSPTTDAPDPNFFSVNPPRDSMEQLSEQTEPNLPLALASLAAHQEQQDRENDHDFRELQALQFAQSAAEQHAHREELDGHVHAGQEHRVHHHQSDAADELRLAAQLSQDLAAAHQGQRQGSPQDHMHEQRQDASQPPPEDQQLQVDAAHAHAHAHAQAAMEQDRLDPDLQRHLQAELQNHDQQLRGALAGGGARPPPPPHYTPTVSATPQLPPLPSLELHAQFHMQDNTPPRKRSKVSRACDECRRKKIKCDAQSELVEQPCSNCRRSNAQCLFSRVPQKRGPSKGYIKELADRINQIEGKLGHSVETALENSSRRSPAEAFPSPIPIDESRKRPFSSISGDGFPTPPPPPRTTAWPGEHRPIRPYISPEQPNTWTANEFFHKAVPPPGFPEPSPLAPRPEANMLEGVPDGLPEAPSQGEPLRAIDDSQFTLYLNIIHPTFPLLANSKERVQTLLSTCPAILQDAFCSALRGLVLVFSPQTGAGAQANGDPSPSTLQLLSQYEAEQFDRSRGNDIVYFQTLAMAAIRSGTVGPLEREHKPYFSVIIGTAVGAGVSLRLFEMVPDPAPSHGLDVDSDDNVALRAWWALVMFTQWNSVSRSVPVLVDQDTAVVSPGLRYITGDPVYDLARISRKITQLALLAKNVGPVAPDSLSGLIANRFAAQLMESITEHPGGFEDPRHPSLHLAFWHATLLSDLVREANVPWTRLTQVVDAVAKMVDLLAANPHILTPLTHHFVVLAALVLAGLIRDETTRPRALLLSTALLGCGLPSSAPWTGDALGILARAVAEAEEGTVKPLQQLAELAATTDAPPPPEGDTAPVPAGGDAQVQGQNGKSKEHRFDAREILARGYLRAMEETVIAGQWQA